MKTDYGYAGQDGKKYVDVSCILEELLTGLDGLDVRMKV